MFLIRNIFKRRLDYTNVFIRRSISKNTTSQSKTANVEEDQPIKFSTSQASTYRAGISLRNDAEEHNSRLWYEPYVIMGSLGVFLIYFTVLREENDLDEGLAMPLFDRLGLLKEEQLQEDSANLAKSQDLTKGFN